MMGYMSQVFAVTPGPMVGYMSHVFTVTAGPMVCPDVLPETFLYNELAIEEPLLYYKRVCIIVV